MTEKIKFPSNFLWGASTSSYQVEGGITNDWSKWGKEQITNQKSKITSQELREDDFICGQACDSWNRINEDLECIKKLNLNTYRFSLEWARIEPEEGKFNQEAINRYRDFLIKLKKENITTVVTLWHWGNPLWISEAGGWAKKKTVKAFSKYVEFIVSELSKHVDYWVTLNEPLIHVFNGYVLNKFPPQEECPINAWRAFNNLVKAHKNAYTIIHTQNKDAQVSITQIVNYFEPHKKYCLGDRIISGLANYFWNERFLNKIKNQLDYIGIDYYFHDKLSLVPPFNRNRNKTINDMGWEIYPEGIYHVLKNLEKYKKPIFVLENGVADKKDKYRADFITQHLIQIHRAMSEGVPVIGYSHWSLLDNFEWAAGWEPKFGLFEVDRKTFKRKIKKSGEHYAKICKNNFLEK